MTARAVVALVGLAACEKAREEPAPPPPPVHAKASAKIRYAAKTQPRYSGENNTYFSIVEDAQLFVVADAPEPEGSRHAADTIGAFPPKDCAPRRDPDEAAMWCALERAHAALRAKHETSAVTAVVVREGEALVAFAGDVPIVLRHGSTRSVIAGCSRSRATTACPRLSIPRTTACALSRTPWVPWSTAA